MCRHTSLKLTPILPDVGAIVALAAPGNDPYWLGLVTHLMHTKVFVRWLKKDDKGVWFVSTTHEDSQLLSTISVSVYWMVPCDLNFMVNWCVLNRNGMNGHVALLPMVKNGIHTS